jgi:hypothetical protein
VTARGEVANEGIDGGQSVALAGIEERCHQGDAGGAEGSPLGGQQRGESAHLVADQNVAARWDRIVGSDLA